MNFEKARAVLFGQWGFGKRLGNDQGASALFHGGNITHSLKRRWSCCFFVAPGTGKSLAAQAVGYEIGKPLKVVNCAELLSKASNLSAVSTSCY